MESDRRSFGRTLWYNLANLFTRPEYEVDAGSFEQYI